MTVRAVELMHTINYAAIYSSDIYYTKYMATYCREGVCVESSTAYKKHKMLTLLCNMTCFIVTNSQCYITI